MTPIYTAQRVSDTENGWMITHNETGKQDLVFCLLEENTAEDAIAVLESISTEEGPQN